MPGARIAVVPDGTAWAEEAVRAGGGELVGPDRAEGLVWANSWVVDGLIDALAASPDIRWVQLSLAGVERFAAAGVFGDGRTWTSAKVIYADQVAEHALALGLAGLRSVVRSSRTQTWEAPSGRVLQDGRVAILGGGGIGRSLLDLLAPFRTRNVVVRRHPEPMAGAERVVGPEDLGDALADADLVVVALALTPETTGVIGASELAAMPEHSWLVNVARGRHVRTDDLVEALQRSAIGGAALDVTDPEPLPDGHPLWSLPNCVITPHIANTPQMTVAPMAALIRENVQRFAAGQPLLGGVDPALGY
ncbi:MAG TPA: D-isomer specific 2-hydroxyacid dehydrogenase family protein [Acidimicrobiales bacterium]|nr:D-isomer specific 2-hydroxyacid dehydrogenase family protein [Acidimicrobiales bacterium]